MLSSSYRTFKQYGHIMWVQRQQVKRRAGSSTSTTPSWLCRVPWLCPHAQQYHWHTWVELFVILACPTLANAQFNWAAYPGLDCLVCRSPGLSSPEFADLCVKYRKYLGGRSPRSLPAHKITPLRLRKNS